MPAVAIRSIPWRLSPLTQGLLAWGVGWGGASIARSEPLPHAAYVWQRAWTPAVGSGLVAAASRLSGVVVLAAETDARDGVVRVALDYPALARSGLPVGLALRNHPQTSPALVEDLAVDLLREASARNLPIAELQLDCDAAEAKLEAYRALVVSVRRRTAPTPLTFTALPAWLRQPPFPALAAASDGFVLQVHSLDAALRLCEPAAARAAVRRASAFGVPFRVALPTYGYVVGVDSENRVVGVQAEGPVRPWPSGTRLLEVRADPVELAGLVAGWNAAPVPHLTGFLWYRLPVAEDRRNWTWATLAAILEGRTPRACLKVALLAPEPGLVEVSLVNDGEADAVVPVRIAVAWREATLQACDAVGGFHREGGGVLAAGLRFAGTPRLAPGGRCAVGWLRFREAREVACEAVLE